ncbi:MAG: hypothetical protein H7834_15360 [Magnetococcus sp. YQC-9]
MSAPMHLIAVIDLAAHPEWVIRAALKLANRNGRSEIRFVTFFDPSVESFEERMEQLRAALHALLLTTGCDPASGEILAGHPAGEMTRLAQEWGASLILTDESRARELQNGWFPWQQKISPLPCPLLIVDAKPHDPATTLGGWLRRLIGMPLPETKVLPR